MSNNENIRKLATSSSAIHAIHSNLVQCGFELEFQSLNGKTNEEDDGSRLDDDVNDAWDESDILDYIDDGEVKAVIEAIVELTECSVREAYSFFSENGTQRRDLRSKIYQEVVNATDAYRDALIANLQEENDYGGGCYGDNLKASKETLSSIDCGDDQSVRGGEIRTEGALSPTQFVKIASDLLNNNEFEVDNGCSFHIHLSVPGVEHQYGKKFQAEMIAYLLENVKRLPESVQKRLRSDPCDRYAKFHVSKDKFSAIHFHGQGTWEFRLFGNVSDASDARRCLLVAIEALRHGYRVKLGLEKSLLGTMETDSIKRMAYEVLHEEFLLKTVTRNFRKQERSAA